MLLQTGQHDPLLLLQERCEFLWPRDPSTVPPPGSPATLLRTRSLVDDLLEGLCFLGEFIPIAPLKLECPLVLY